MKNAIPRARTGDRGPPDGPEIFTVEQLGPNREVTANGNLVCYDVPIARVGWMIYGPGETPVEVDPETGYARVYRGESELFRPETIGSFMGVAVTDDHPEDDVDPDNWDKLSRGFTTTNVRRGTGDLADCIIADLIVTRRDLIDAVNDGKREVSCGYSADYRQTGPGTGEQLNIIGNHIALVERGRCGPRCAIGDQAPPSTTAKESKMPKQRVKLSERVRTLVRDMESLLEENGGSLPGEEDSPDDDSTGATHIHIHTNGQGAAAPGEQRAPGTDDDLEGGDGDPMEARLSALEQGMAALAEQLQAILQQLGGGQPPTDAGQDEGTDVDPDNPDADPDDQVRDEAGDVDPHDNDLKRAGVGDSQALATSFQQLLADAEILVPGFRPTTFDAAAKRSVTIDAMCKLRRRALTAALATRDGASLIEAAAGSKCDVDSMTCQQAAQLFRAAVTARKVINNAGATRDANKLPIPNGGQSTPGKTLTVAEVNEANKAFWANRVY